MKKRRVRIGDKNYKIDKLTRNQKFIVMINHFNPDDWLFVSESDSYLRIVKKSTLESNPVIKNIDKYRK